MRIRLLTLLFSLYTVSAMGQIDIPTMRYAQSPAIATGDGSLLPLGLSGGLNAPAYSTIDLNADDRTDLVLFDRTADRFLTFLRSSPGYAYAPEYENTFPEGVRYWALLVDMNCDGVKDLVSSTGSGVQVHLGNGLGGTDSGYDTPFTLQSETTNGTFNIFASSSDLPAIEDIDGDGDMDILVMDFTTGDQINYHRNMSVENTGTCSNLVYRRETRTWGGVRECDCGVITFGEDPCPSTGGRYGQKLLHAGGKALTLADFDGDGDKDLMLGDETCEAFYYMENVGDKDEALMTGYTTSFPSGEPARPGYLPSAYVEDIDGDGLDDLIVATGLPRRPEINADYEEGSWYYRNTGNGLILQTKAFLQEDMADLGELASVVLTDVDNDGDNDLLASTYGQETDSAFIATLYLYTYELLENGQYAYVLKDADYLGFSALGVRNLKIGRGRINDDALPDLVFQASDRTSFATGLYYIPATSSAFDYALTAAVELPVVVEYNSTFTLEDVTGEGLADILVGRQFGSVVYYRNNGGAFSRVDDTFLGIIDNAARSSPHLAFADFNNDGSRDMMVTDFSGGLYFYSDYRNASGRLEDRVRVMSTYDGIEEVPVRVDNRNWLAVEDMASAPNLLMATGRGGISYLRNTSADEMPVLPGALDIKVYPVPAVFDFITVTTNRTCIIDIFDTAGREVRFDVRLEGNEIVTFPLDDLPPGLYFVRARTNSGQDIEKFVKYD